jgi:glycosyltransferase involved in cell wall biosynthesis
VVVSRTKIDNFYFDNSVVRFFTSGDVKALAEAMCDVIHNPALRERLIAGGYRYVDLHSWDRRKHEYLNLVDTLSTQIFSTTGSRAIEPAHADR